MFKRSIVIFLFLIAFYGSSESFFTVSERRNLLVFISLLSSFMFFMAPSIFATNKKKGYKEGKELEIVDKQWGEGQYHNDFTRVGSAEDISPVKPVDYAGDAIAHANETISEDIKIIEEYVRKEEDS